MKLLKRILLVLVILIVLLIVFVRLTIHESRPEIVGSDQAEIMAQNMLEAINIEAWDTLPYITWTFPGEHHYFWDKVNNNARISWDEYEVHLNMDQVDGRAYKNGVELTDKEKEKTIQKAWSHWCNDSFWLNAPSKIFDKGTERAVAIDKDGKEGLLISYSSGGVTPGDQYLWFQDEKGLPTGYKMWVKIIPIGGVYASWENWQNLPGGAKVASKHELSLGGMTLELTGIKGASDWKALGFDSHPIVL